MLVKVGKVWVDPMRVTNIYVDKVDGLTTMTMIDDPDVVVAVGLSLDEAAQIINRCREQTMAMDLKATWRPR